MVSEKIPPHTAHPLAFHEPGTYLDEAKAIIYGDREKTYGDPGRNLRHIAAQWQLYIRQRYNLPDFILSPEDVCYMMADLKKCRQMNCGHRDNLVDGIGYLALIERL